MVKEVLSAASCGDEEWIVEFTIARQVFKCANQVQISEMLSELFSSKTRRVRS